jgi:hypothetical protein
MYRPNGTLKIRFYTIYPAVKTAGNNMGSRYATVKGMKPKEIIFCTKMP